MDEAALEALEYGSAWAMPVTVLTLRTPHLLSQRSPPSVLTVKNMSWERS